MSFQTLPTELLVMIAEGLTEDRDINSLAQTNRHISRSINEMLYRHNAANRDTALYWGVKEHVLATVTMAVEAGADIELKRNGLTPLIVAIKQRDIDIVKYILEKGADPNAHGEHGLGALHFAIKTSSLASVSLLLEHGADPNILDDRLNTPLHFQNQPRVSLKIARLLLHYGANSSAQNCHMESPVHKAVQRNDLGFLRLLLKFEPEVSALDLNHRSPLAQALRRLDDGIEVARLLLKHGANPEATSASQPRHPIHDVAQLGFMPGLTLLLEFQADVNARDYLNETALSLAIKHGHTSMARALIQAGAQVEFDDSNTLRFAQTPLQRAAIKGDAMLCELLLKNDPNPDIREVFSRLSITEYDSPRATEILAYKGLSAQKMKNLMA